MAAQSATISVALLAAILFVGVASGQTNNTCSGAILQLYSCLEFTTGAATQPSTACCSGLGNVVKSEPQCLCSVIGGGGGGTSARFGINETLALLLPRACNVQTPPVSQCKSAHGSPAASPNAAPKPSLPQGGSKAVPPPDHSKASGGVAMPLLLLLFTTFVGSSAMLSISS